MALISLLLKDPLAFLLLVIPLLYSIILHEVAHGWVAFKMGDPTAKWLGRLNLNPLKHLDPIGTLMLLIFGFGWAKPVPVMFANLRNQRWGFVFVSSAGIIINLVLAFLAFFIFRIFSPQQNSVLHIFLEYLARINIMLAAFNLIPIPPLDGSKIVMGFMSDRWRSAFSKLEPYGFFIIIGLLYLGALNPVINLFSAIIRWVIVVLLPA